MENIRIEITPHYGGKWQVTLIHFGQKLTWGILNTKTEAIEFAEKKSIEFSDNWLKVANHIRISNYE